MEICVDSREPEEIVKTVAKIAGELGMTIATDAYDTADIFIGNVLGIERKTPSDYIASIKDGRLFQQVHEMRENFQVCVVMVEGTLSELLARHVRGQMNPNAVVASVCSLVAKHGVSVLFVGNHMEWVLYHIVKKAMDKDIPTYTPVRKHATEDDYAVCVLAGFPGIGVKTANCILNVYGSLANAMQNVDKWKDEVDGVGEKTVEAVKKCWYASRKDRCMPPMGCGQSSTVVVPPARKDACQHGVEVK